MDMPLRSVSSPAIWGPPQVSFFAYYMGAALGSVSSQITMWGPPRSVSCILYRAPFISVSFLLYGGPPSCQLLRLSYGGPRSVSLLTIWAPPDNIFLRFKLPLGGPIFFNFQGSQMPPPASPPPPTVGAHGLRVLM